MQLKMYNWNITDKIRKSTLRQGVITAKNEKVAREYLVASMSKDEDELYLDKTTTLSLIVIYSYKVNK